MKKVNSDNKRRESIKLTANFVGKAASACLFGMGIVCAIASGAVAYEQVREHDLKSIGNAALCGLWIMFTAYHAERLVED